MATLNCEAPGCGVKKEAEKEETVVAMMQLHQANVHPPVQGQAANTAMGYKGQKIERPKVSENESDEVWVQFKHDWANYKRYYELKDKDKINLELQQCCDSKLRTKIAQDHDGGVNELDEEQLLARIKRLAISSKHVNAHRSEFDRMKQDQGEKFTSWVLRLRDKAVLCKYTVKGCPECKCNHDIPMMESMIEHIMVERLYNNEDRQRILTDPTMTSYKAKYDMAVLLEDTGRTSSKSQPVTSNTEARVSDLKQQRRDAMKTKCEDCKKSFSGLHHIKKSNKTIKVSKCTKCFAKTITCRKCTQKGHFSSDCKVSKSDMRNEEDSNEEDVEEESNTDNRQSGSYSFSFKTTSKASRADDREYSKSQRRLNNGLRRIHNVKDKNTVMAAVPNLEWNGNSFVKKPPSAQPRADVTMTVMAEEMKHWGQKLTKQEEQSLAWKAKVTALPDTGSQTTSSGPAILRRLGISPSRMLKTNHSINGAGDGSLNIMGALLVKVTSSSGLTARTMLYVCSNESTTILSKTVCKELGIASVDDDPSCNVRESRGEEKCDCPARAAVPDLPSDIPFDPVDENVSRLEDWMKEFWASSAFNTCPHQPLQEMTGEPLNISFKENFTPVTRHKPVPVPYHWKEQVKADLERDVRLGIIEPVPIGVPVKNWLSKMVVAPKKDGKPRRTVDLQHVNAATRRETHHTRSPHELVVSIPTDRYKTVLDAWNGYHSLKLAPDAKDATQFITEWGRFWYCRAPQGFHASGDGYTARYDKITTDNDIKNFVKCIDDSLLHEKTIRDQFWATMRYISVCAKNGIVFNPDKFLFAKKEVDFAGFRVTMDGYKPTAALLEAIEQFPMPRDLTGVRSWFGLVQQVHWAYSDSKPMERFREFLKKDTQFKLNWDSDMEAKFYESRKVIANMVRKGVKGFTLGKPTFVAGDWSKQGIGFELLQKHCNCDMAQAPSCGKGKKDAHWQLVLAGSRFTQDAETRYSPIEGEALALSYALEQTRMYTLGNPNLIVGTDHKPLVSIMGLKDLDEIKNPRVRGFKDKTLMYSFTTIHVPGKDLKVPDATSRYPVTAATTKGTSTTARMESTYSLTQARRVETENFRSVTWETVVEACKFDEVAIKLNQTINDGFPDKLINLDPQLKNFWTFRDDLYTLEGVPMAEERMFIPASLRHEVLENLHAAHQGEATMIDKASYKTPLK